MSTNDAFIDRIANVIASLIRATYQDFVGLKIDQKQFEQSIATL